MSFALIATQLSQKFTSELEATLNYIFAVYYYMNDQFLGQHNSSIPNFFWGLGHRFGGRGCAPWPQRKPPLSRPKVIGMILSPSPRR
jgi:hypothetical protein